MRAGRRLGSQRCSLLDAEPMLLVDHDQTQVGELDALPNSACVPITIPASGGDPRQDIPSAAADVGRSADHFGGMLCRRQRAALREVAQHGGDGVQVLRR